MKKLLNFIALVPNERNPSTMYTAYLFQKEDKFVLPVEMTKSQAKHLLQNSNKVTAVPSIYNTFKRTILCLNHYVKEVLIFNFQDGILYAYLVFDRNGKKVHVNISCQDALIIAKYFKINVFIEQNTLEKCGIKVSEKILRDALREDF